jgi:glutathione S-transferase
MGRLLHLQGLGRYGRDEIYAMGRADLRAAADLLGDRPFFLGERLTTIDAVAFGFLANVLLVPVETELKRIAQDLPNLVAWAEAMEAGLGGERLCCRSSRI